MVRGVLVWHFSATPNGLDIQLFENDFAALLSPPRPAAPPSPHPLLQTQPVGGVCDVLVFHPRHDLTIARLTVSEIETIIDRWKIIYTKRGAQGGIKYVQIFEVSGFQIPRSASSTR
jgi:UDPglucose--hexose-1-phosphate uridylyltransferase